MDVILNWLWQGALVACVLDLFLRAVPTLRGETRYRLWRLALGTVLAVPVLTSWPAGAEHIAATSEVSAAARLRSGVGLLALPAGAGVLVPALVVLWCVWAGVSTMRLGLSLAELRRIRRACRAFPAERERRLRHWLSLRAGGRAATLAVSKDVTSAAVVGLGAPVIAVAPALLASLDDDELDRVIVHEWAHVQRRDERAKLVEQGMRAFAGFNPGVWWITRRLQIEREVACDERVVQATGDPRTYAACLAKLASVVSGAGDPVAAPLGRANLSTRIVRLLDRRVRRQATGTALAGALLVLATTMAVTEVALIGLATPDGRAPSSALPSQPADELSDPQSVARWADSPPAAPGYARQGMARLPELVRRGPATGATAPAPSSSTFSPTSTAETNHEPAALLEVDPDHDAAGGSPPPVEAEPILVVPLMTAFAPPPARDTVPALRGRPPPWTRAADAGVAAGRGSQRAALATAGFFKRMSKSIAGAF